MEIHLSTIGLRAEGQREGEIMRKRHLEKAIHLSTIVLRGKGGREGEREGQGDGDTSRNNSPEVTSLYKHLAQSQTWHPNPTTSLRLIHNGSLHSRWRADVRKERREGIAKYEQGRDGTKLCHFLWMSIMEDPLQVTYLNSTMFNTLGGKFTKQQQ